MPPRPVENSYWVVPGKLLAGEYPRNINAQSSHGKVVALTDAGISAFIDLAQYGEYYPHAQWLGEATHQRYPIVDGSAPESHEAARVILDVIDGHIAGGRPPHGMDRKGGHSHRVLVGAAGKRNSPSKNWGITDSSGTTAAQGGGFLQSPSGWSCSLQAPSTTARRSRPTLAGRLPLTAWTRQPRRERTGPSTRPGSTPWASGCSPHNEGS